jgi:excisionase family DNA binding protein
MGTMKEIRGYIEEQHDIGTAIDNALLRAPKVAKVLDISTSMAYRMMQAGQLPTVRLGRSLRVPNKALARWIDERTKPGVAA